MKKHGLWGIAAAVVLSTALLGCDDDPAKGAVRAEATAAQPAAAEPAKGAVKYKFDQSNSKVEYVGAKVTLKHPGGFDKFDGAIDVVDADPTKSRVAVEIVMDSITSDAEKLTGHLKSPDFFDVAKYPKSRFTSTSIRAGGEKGATHTVTGNLEMRGVTKSITFPATISVQDDVVTVRTEFAINRKDFGIVYPGMPDDLIKDEVLIRLNLAAKKSADRT